MKKLVIAVLIIIFILIPGSTLVYASMNDMSFSETINSFLVYNFRTVKEVSDQNIGVEYITSKPGNFTIYEPVNVNEGWLFDLAGGGILEISVGTLEFDEGALKERYIDINGEYGEVRLLQNSFSSGNEYNKTLFWSAKQQVGTSIKKGSFEDIKCVILFERHDGSCYLYGYMDAENTDYWTLEIPESEYYLADVIDFDGKEK